MTQSQARLSLQRQSYRNRKSGKTAAAARRRLEISRKYPNSAK